MERKSVKIMDENLNSCVNDNFSVYTERLLYRNGSIITWILHQIIMYSNKMKIVAG